MSNREFEGKTLQEALERAMAELGPSAADLKYEILADGRKGFLGIGGRNVRVRLLEPGEKLATPPEEDPGLDRWNRESSGGRQPVDANARGRGSSSRGAAPRSAPSGSRGGASGGMGSRSGASGGAGGRSGASGSPGPPRGPRGTARGPSARDSGRRSGTSNGESTERSAPAPRIDRPPQAEAAGGAQLSLHETVRSVAGRILGNMGLDLKARLRDRDGTVILELSGADARILLQEDGEAIVALQHILNRIVSRDERFDSRIVVDCAGFRDQRDQEVVERAMRSAEEALRTGSSVHLEGLNAYERRLAHIALSENGAIRTYSTGEGAIKQLTIEPVGDPPDSQEP